MADASESHSSVIEDLLVEVLERSPAERPAHLEELCKRHPDLADGLRSGFDNLRDLGLLDPTGADAEDELPEQLGDFRLIERLGAGGMGVVYLAEQVSLGRQVALKLVRSEQLYFPRARERFQREVEAVAQLSHPSIVPVYMVGEERGIPYFAMKRVEGISLSDAISAWKNVDPATLRGSDLRRLAEEGAGREASARADAPVPLYSGSWTETCLRIVREVAEALAHSHERGILHRDVKPSNIMVTPEGAVQLLDFGLASSSRSDGSITRSGGRLGSLPYMAPEQVEGRNDEVGERTDIYNLGATLYEMLALRRAFPHDTDAQLVRAIVSTPPASLRKAFPHLPADVETVCLKALEPERERRYDSAASFARDLQNLLELRPIEARRANRLVRTKRWAQRNPGWTAASVLGALLAVGGPTGFGVQQHFAKERVQGALDSANHERARADANFGRALAALDLLTEIGEIRLAEVPQAEEARRQILEEALAFYKSFLAEEGGGSILRREVARALMRKGSINYALGDLDEAREALEEARARLDELVLTADEETLQYEFGRTLSLLGELAFLHGDVDAAETDQRSAVEHLSAYVFGEGTSSAGPHDTAAPLLASALGRLSRVLIAGERSDEAALLLQEATARSGAALAQREDGHLRRAHAQSLEDLGIAQIQSGSPDAAEETFFVALEALEPLLDSRPELGVRQTLARLRLNLGKIASDRGLMDEALAQYEPGIEVAEAIVRDHPSVIASRALLADFLANSGVAHTLSQRREEADPFFEQAIATYEELVELQPDALYYVGRMGSLQCSVATSHFLDQDWGRAEGLYIDAITNLQLALDASTLQPDQRVQLSRARLNLAWTHLNQGRHAEVLPLLDEVPMPDGEGAMRPLFAAFLTGSCIALAEGDETLDPEERADTAALYIERALEYVAQSLEESTDAPGLVDVFAMDRYDPLRDLPEFQAIMADLDAMVQ